jgi:chemotaxis protein methyltransferase CheR
MTDRECIDLLQWALPRMRLRWSGFRSVRRQVCKRLRQRISLLDLSDAAAYRSYVEQHPEEWVVLDRCCRITISRFYRGKGTFRALTESVLPDLARAVRSRGGQLFTCWSAGCASGEEPFSLAILWKLGLQQRFPDLHLDILATDVDEAMLERARQGVYRESSLKDLPAAFRAESFDAVAGEFMIREPFRAGVRFRQHDLRLKPPDGPFDLVLCRNCAFTYFEESLQQDVLAAITSVMAPGGALIIGNHESLPPGAEGVQPWIKGSGVFRNAPEQRTRLLPAQGPARPAVTRR